MQQTDLYSAAHLIVAVIRILEYRKKDPASIDSICKELSFSKEECNVLVKRLTEMGIIEQVSSAYDARLYIKDHLSIENIPNECKESKLDEELKKFQSNRNSMMHQVQSFQLKQEAKKKKLFAELEEQLKKGKKVSKFL